MTPRHSLEMLPSVPKLKKAVMLLTDKIHVLDKLPSDIHYSATGHEFNIDESTMLSIICLKTEIHIKQGYLLISWQKML